jgi:hypothetical protein
LEVLAESGSPSEKELAKRALRKYRSYEVDLANIDLMAFFGPPVTWEMAASGLVVTLSYCLNSAGVRLPRLE